ncbi:MAG: hypothetical protein JNL11_11155 [Bdellovibrionaceae bacterium]|nr:hypothetical protein [Pseudobdellovibrionaceae bacterium]
MTKSQIFFTILFGVLLKTMVSSAFSLPENCRYNITARANMQFGQSYQKETGECWFSISPFDAYQTLSYRSFLVSSSGLLFVFNSYGYGPNSTHTGAREYYFFPRESFTGQVVLNDDMVSVRMNYKLTLQFETKNIYPLNTENIMIRNATSVNAKNAGGMEVLRYNGVYLDTGFTLGKSPSEVKSNKSMFKNQFGQKCMLLNSLIFDYKDEQPYLMHDVILHQVVAKQCPNFRWVD